MPIMIPEPVEWALDLFGLQWININEDAVEELGGQLLAFTEGLDAFVESVGNAIGTVAEVSDSTALTSYAIELADAWLSPYGVEVASPRDPSRRGAHITLRHPDALALTQALTDRDVIPDFRHPDGIRVGLAPLTTRFADVHDGLRSLQALLGALAQA